MPSKDSSAAELLREGTRALREAGGDSPGLDAEILLREALGLTREQLFAQLPGPVCSTNARIYRNLVRRRVDGEPIAYITERRAFYGRDFIVNRRVLIPRPETEYLVDYAVEWLGRHSDRKRLLVDVGCGSGVIALSIACEVGLQHHVIGSEASLDALLVATSNRQNLRAPADLVAGSLLDWCAAPVDIIAANLPYLRPDQAHAGIEHEPPIALYAGEDGFQLNRELIRQAASLLARPGGLIMEIDPGQASLAHESARESFPDARIQVRPDLAGTARYLIAEIE